jgi:hypothetical protein
MSTRWFQRASAASSGRRRVAHRRFGATLIAALTVSLVGGCSGDDGPAATSGGDGGTELPESPATPSGAMLLAVGASFEIVAGRPQRVLFGLAADDGTVLAGGDVAVRFRQVAPVAGTADPLSPDVIDTRATYYPVPGQTAVAPATATLGPPSAGLGVYAAQNVVFPLAGFWQANLTYDSASGPVALQTAVSVLPESQVPDVGDPAPRTSQRLPSDPDANLAIIDSRMSIDGMTALPDPDLHDARISDLLTAGTPFVVVVSTPTFCQSQFCGPITEMGAELGKEYAGRVKVIHLEVWKDFEANVINAAAAEWIVRNNDGKEPWAFVVDRTGTITARFDNVVNETDLRAAMEAVAPAAQTG